MCFYFDSWYYLSIFVFMQRNYRYFFMFVSSSTLLCMYVFAMSALYIKVQMDQYESTVWKAMKESPASVILMAYCFVSLWFVGGLTGFHLYLIGTNQVGSSLRLNIFFFYPTIFENGRCIINCFVFASMWCIFLGKSTLDEVIELCLNCCYKINFILGYWGLIFIYFEYLWEIVW